MLDGMLKRRIDPVLSAVGKWLVKRDISANHVTYGAFIIGMIAALAIATGYPVFGLFLIIISRVGDGLDGAVARNTNTTDFGGLIDIVLDFVFYGAIPLAFVFLDPVANGLAGAVLIFSFYINGASFLAYAAIAEKRGQHTTDRGTKSIYFTTGLAEATETYLVFAIFCLWPSGFATVAWIFALICIYTATARLVLARGAFPDNGNHNPKSGR